jgi:predicted ferric reductase
VAHIFQPTAAEKMALFPDHEPRGKKTTKTSNHSCSSFPARAIEPRTTYKSSDYQKWLLQLEMHACNHGASWIILSFTFFLIILFFFRGVQLQYSYLSSLKPETVISTTLLFAGCVARGSAFVLNICFTLLLIPVNRSLMDWLRRRRINTILPINKAINFHVGVALLACMAAMFHAAGALTLYSARFYDVREGGATGLLSIFCTGIILSMLLIIIVVTSYKPQRQKNFPLFWNIHQLFIVLYGVLCLHGCRYSVPTTWAYVVVPLVMYLCDRYSRHAQGESSTFQFEWGSQAKITSACVRSGSTVLRVELPNCMEFKAGQYAELRCPSLSKTEWHPFTIASCPLDGKIVFYISCKGRKNSWTTRLYELYTSIGSGAPARRNNPNLSLSWSSLSEQILGARSFTHQIDIRGPFGAPAQCVDQFENVVLVAGGIGFTPMLSLLRQLVFTEIRQESVDGTPSEDNASYDSFLSNEVIERIIRSPSFDTASFMHQSTSRSDGTRDRRSSTSFTLPSPVSGLPIFFASVVAIVESVLMQLFLATLTLSVFFIEGVCLSIVLPPLTVQDIDNMTPVFQNEMALDYMEVFSALIFTFVTVCYMTSELFNFFCRVRRPIQMIRILFCMSSSSLLIFATVNTLDKGGALDVAQSWRAYVRLAVIAAMLVVVIVPRFMESVGSVVASAPHATGNFKRLRSVHLIVVNRTFGDQEWLLRELQQLQDITRQGLFSFDLFITRSKGASKHPLQQMSKTQRPDFHEIFRDISMTKFAMCRCVPVGIFFCGSPALGKAVQKGASMSMIEDFNNACNKTPNDNRNNAEPNIRSLKALYSFHEENFS